MNTIKTVLHFGYTLLTLCVLLLAGVLFVTSRKQPLGGIHSYAIQTGSMSPQYPVGSVVFTRGMSRYELGDVIAFKRSGDVVTHRVVSILSLQGKRTYIVKGDANTVVDTQGVQSDAVIGKIIFSLPSIGRVFSLLDTPLGVIVLIGIPTILLILHEVWIIKTEFELIIEKKVREKLATEVSETIRSYLSASHTTGG